MTKGVKQSKNKKRVLCEKHGLVSGIEFSQDGELIKRVCFKRWVDQICDGLPSLEIVNNS